MITEVIKGDLINLTLEGKFQATVQGVNAFNTQGAGLAKQMASTFGTDKFTMEQSGKGNYNKMSCIDWGLYNKANVNNNKCTCLGHTQAIYGIIQLPVGHFYVINAYTQYSWGMQNGLPPVDYAAIELCFKKINHMFKSYHVGIPKIGAGLAGGDWNRISEIINKTTPHINITLVEL